MKYICKNCKEDWEFYPKDYHYNKKKYPESCPLCEMPRKQAFDDIRETEGLWEAIKFIIKNRIFK